MTKNSTEKFEANKIDDDIADLLKAPSVFDGDLPPPPPKKINQIGLKYYGEKFTRFQKIEELTPLLARLKDFYYAERMQEPLMTTKEIMKRFNEKVCFPEGKTFFPYLVILKKWRSAWDFDIAESLKQAKRDDTNALIFRRREAKQLIATRDENNDILMGKVSDVSLEEGMKTLGGELLNDAMQMLKDDQQLSEVYKDDVLIKRRNYIVNVFGHVTKLVHGKASLMLKASQEKRENASFLMTLLAKATAGNISDEQMDSLKTTYSGAVVGEVITPATPIK